LTIELTHSGNAQYHDHLLLRANGKSFAASQAVCYRVSFDKAITSMHVAAYYRKTSRVAANDQAALGHHKNAL
jgi:hypothetical protein